MRRRLFLKVGDKVTHNRYLIWGTGEVVEEKHSTLSGGLCLVRVIFEDGNERSFINDMDNDLCCYYSGIMII